MSKGWPQSDGTYVKTLLTKFRRGRPVYHNPERSPQFYEAVTIVRDEGYKLRYLGCERFVAEKIEDSSREVGRQ